MQGSLNKENQMEMEPFKIKTFYFKVNGKKIL